MATYGRLKRNTSIKRKFTLSPTKHSFKELDSELSSSQTSLFSSITNSSTDLSAIETNNTVLSLETKNLSCVENPLIVHDQPSSPILKPVKTSNFNLIFADFEQLDNDNYSCKRQRKLDSKKTTIFSNKKEIQLDIPSNEELIEFSEDQISSEIITSLNNLNTRLSELQSKIEINNNQTSCDEIHSIKFPNDNSLSSLRNRNYGGTRTFKLDSHALSEEENEVEDFNENEIVNTSLANTNKCKSLEELRLSNSLENLKFDYEMTINNINYELSKNKLDDSKLLILKLELYNKIKSDTAFYTYTQNYINNKEKNDLQKTLVTLLKHSKKGILINFQLISYFKITDLQELDVIMQIELFNKDNMTLKQYANDNLKFNGKLIDAIIKDWIKFSKATSVNDIILEMLLVSNKSLLLSLNDKEKTVILKFLLLCLDSAETLKSLKVLKEYIIQVKCFDNLDIIKKVASLITIDKYVDDITLNSLLECNILILCDNNILNSNKNINKIMFQLAIWDKLWSIVDQNNVIDPNISLSVIRENQCLFALGYLSSFRNFDENINEFFHLSTLIKLMDSISSNIENRRFTLLQIHCLGYFGSISYYFLTKIKVMNNKRKSQIKCILEKYLNSKYTFNEKLNKEINSIMQVI